MLTIEKIIINLASKTFDWIIHELPFIIILILSLYILNKIMFIFLRKGKHTMIKRAQRKIKDIDEFKQRIDTLFYVLNNTSSVIFWIIGIIWILKRLGLDISPIMASAGIAGVALGFGAQAIVKDFLAGCFILLENQISIGDVAKINGIAGEVIRIELRCTTLRDFEGVVHIFQNGKIDNLANLTKEWSAIVFDIEVAYKEDMDHVIKVMNKVAQDLFQDQEFKKYIIEKPEILGVDNFGSNGIFIKARLKTKPVKQWSVGREYRKRLKKAFDDSNIEIPFPQRVLHWAEGQKTHKEI